jgi:effector-binding domain-containing protein
MLDTPLITRTPARLTAVIHLVIPRDEIGVVMGPGVVELMAAVAAQHVATAGPWFTHHLRMVPDSFDFEIGVPVASPVVAAGRMRPAYWPAMTVAQTVLHGGYEGLGAAWKHLDSWIAKHGHVPAPDLWESYVAGPETGPDPAKWRTELSRPIELQTEPA